MTPLPGLHLFRLPIPYPMKTVTVLVCTQGPPTLIDTGVNHPETLAALELALNSLNLRFADLERVILTHNHPDHSGLSGAVARASGAVVQMLDHEIDSGRAWMGPQWFPAHQQHMHDHGLPPAMAPVLEGFLQSRREIDPPEHFEPLHDGDALELAGESFEVRWMPGHSDGHLVLWGAGCGLLIAGDVILERITPHIGLYASSRPDPLGDYLNSLEAVVQLAPRQTVVGHYGPLIEGGAARANEIAAHHRQRLERLYTLLERPQTGFEVSLELFPRALPDSGRRFALTETLAHLEHLRLQGTLHREWVDQGWVYARTQ